MKTLLRSIITLLVFAACFSPARADAVKAGDTLPPWSEGCLDIHHINTGRGESSFIIMPDGTTLLVDAGVSNAKKPYIIGTLPDETREPGEWIARYIKRAGAGTPSRALNYMLVTHFHSDHLGDPSKNSKITEPGGYKLAGVTEVAEHVAIEKIIDRGWPEYDFPAPQKGAPGAMVANYRKFLDWQIANKGVKVERFNAGVTDQLAPRHNPSKYPNFEIRNLAVNGVVWTGVGTNTRNHFPDPKDVAKGAIIENNCSAAFRLSYGAFDYFSGGDLSVLDLETASTAEQWIDIERPVALVTGPVDVMKANHHAYRDSNSPFFLGVLRPRVVVIPIWNVAQPSINTYRRMQSKKTWPGARDLFLLSQPEAAQLATRLDKKGPPPGHVVIRVKPGGAEYSVYVIEETNESGRVKSVHGPYKSR
ncbi:beta-lactamase superfamily II metal-dependent hydrolase [Ereboglobus sp. PH5-5]|uniref:ComEC/Rec2 family competence protein n=1 Tax=Ereboglobus sp. PH5-5 TaxID=2940529 RepID=UPI002404ED58|nr:MBL fold metallo-hydrolase [Ereboglobus sp. PH5-5]MDF9832620.1 beta-lactamase superfamily II metal-dependent hydrolase [Ereboglobus sp. PH5-5]